MSIKLESLPERYRLQVIASKGGALPPVAPANDATGQGKRIRQRSGSKLNKLEHEFLGYLEFNMRQHSHYAQSLTFLLANGVRFTPDFISISKLTGMMIAHETKGYMRDDAAVKIKVAASVFPLIKWNLVTKLGKRKGGGWQIDEVLP